MVLVLIAGAIAGFGWAIVTLSFSQRDAKAKVLAKYTSLSGMHMGGSGADTTTNSHFFTLEPFPVRITLIFVILAILPTIIIIIPQTWLSIVLLIVFGLTHNHPYAVALTKS